MDLGLDRQDGADHRRHQRHRPRDRAAARAGRMPDRDLRAHAGEARCRDRRSFAMRTGFIADIGKPADVAALVEDTVKAFGRIDIVVSNAGTHISGRIDDVASDVLLRHFQTKVVGPWELARCVAPHMRRQGGGRFIVIIGQTGKVPQANAIPSTVVNAAQHAFVKSLSDELAQRRDPGQRRVPEPHQEPAHRHAEAHNEMLSRAQPRAAGDRLGRRGAARPLGHAGRHRQCGRVPRLRARRLHLRQRISTSMAATSVRSFEPMIRIENVSKSFYKGDTAVDAVRDMSLTIARHEIVAVIGPSGCGKSTLLNMIAGLYAPTRGRDRLQGRQGVRREHRRRLHDAEGQPAALAQRARQCRVSARARGRCESRNARGAPTR